jgi:cytochrome P450
MIKVPVSRGLWGHFDIKKQMTQPLPATIDIDAWSKDYNTMVLCELFGVPYETYQASQINKA